MTTPMARQPRPVFILAAPHGGGGILHLAIGQHRNIRPVFRMDWILDLEQALPAVPAHVPTSRQPPILFAMGLDGAGLRQRLGQVIDAMVVDDPDRAPLTDPGVAHAPQRWVAHTPWLSPESGRLAALFPDAQFLAIHRDRDEAVASMMRTVNERAEFQRSWTRDEAINDWTAHAVAIEAAQHDLPPGSIMTLDFGDLRRDPERVLRACFAFLGEEWDERATWPLVGMRATG